MRSLDVLWGMRLHSLMLATLHAIPFIALIYDVKVWRFLEEIGCTEWGIPLDASFSAEKLITLEQRLEARLPEMRCHLLRQAERLSTRAKVNAELLREIAREAAPQETALQPIPEPPKLQEPASPFTSE
jgi:polysaccharide pyruvyl transferase WcaK-like protein